MRRQVTKQMILIITCLVFALTLSGTVAANENTSEVIEPDTISTTDNQVSENQLLKTVITGQVLDCTTNEPFSQVNVTAKNNGEELASTLTGADGKYELQFLSNLTTFNVTASYPNHKPSSQQVTTNHSENDSELQTGSADFHLGKPKVLFLLGGLSGTSDIYPALIEAINNRQDIESTIIRKNAIPADLDFKSFDMIFIDAIWTSTPNYEALKARLQEAMAANVTVVTRAIYGGTLWDDVCNVNMTQHSWIPTYWTNTNLYMTTTSVHNSNNLVDYLCVKLLGLNSINAGGNPLTPLKLPKEGIYHPDAPTYFTNLTNYLNWYTVNYDSNKPTVAICFGQGNYNNLNTAVIDALIRAFEALDYNVIPYFYDHEGYAQGQPLVDQYLIKDGKCIADLIIHYRAAGWNTVIPLDNVTVELERLNVPIVKAFTFDGTYEEWLNATIGVSSSDLSYTMANMEIQGIIEPIVIASEETNAACLTVNIPINRQIQWMVDCCKAWIKLNPKYTPNSEKKIAIVYWSPTGKDKGAGASHLDVYASIPELLQALKNSGYNLETNHYPIQQHWLISPEPRA